MTAGLGEPAQGGSWPVNGFFMGIMFSAAILAFVYWRYRSWLDAHFRRCVCVTHRCRIVELRDQQNLADAISLLEDCFMAVLCKLLLGSLTLRIMCGELSKRRLPPNLATVGYKDQT